MVILSHYSYPTVVRCCSIKLLSSSISVISFSHCCCCNLLPGFFSELPHGLVISSLTSLPICEPYLGDYELLLFQVLYMHLVPDTVQCHFKFSPFKSEGLCIPLSLVQYMEIGVEMFFKVPQPEGGGVDWKPDTLNRGTMPLFTHCRLYTLTLYYFYIISCFGPWTMKIANLKPVV